MLIGKLSLVFIIVTLKSASASKINDDQCDEQLFAIIEAITAKEFWALKR